MFNIYYIGIWKNEEKPAVELCAERDLTSISLFTRSIYNNAITFASEFTAERTHPGLPKDSYETLKEGSYYVFPYARSEGLAGIVITEQGYPDQLGKKLVRKILEEFLTRYPRSAWATSNAQIAFPLLKEYIVTYKDPDKVDPMMAVNKALVETKTVAHKTIESLLERGEKMNDLVAKSDNLSAQSKMFYTQAKKQNSCCAVM